MTPLKLTNIIIIICIIAILEINTTRTPGGSEKGNSGNGNQVSQAKKQAGGSEKGNSGNGNQVSQAKKQEYYVSKQIVIKKEQKPKPMKPGDEPPSPGKSCPFS